MSVIDDTRGPAAAVPRLVRLNEGAAQRRRASRLARLRSSILRASVIIAILVFWQIASTVGLIASTTLPSLTDVLAALWDLIVSGDIAKALPVSLHRAGVGFAFGASIGLALGLFAGLWKVGEEVFDAPLQVFRAIPFIALLPLFITWFGIDELSKTMLIVFATIFPVYLNVYGGARGVDQKLIESARVLGMTGSQIATRVILPTAFPSIVTGLRFSSSVALLALVVSEQLNARSGIGFLLNTASELRHNDIVIALVLVYAVLGILLDVFWRTVERLALPWRKNVAI